MRHQWRLLLRAQLGSKLNVSSRSSNFQVRCDSNLKHIRYFTSLLRDNSVQGRVSSTPIFDSQFENIVNPNRRNLITRGLSSDSVVENEESSDLLVLSDIFSKSVDSNEIKKELESNEIVISHETVLKVLEKLESKPDIAIRFFDWVLESESERLSSKSYNLILKIHGVNGSVKEFWEMVTIMKKKGYGISKFVRDKVLEKFENEGLETEVKKLNSVFASGSTDNSEEKVSSRASKIIRNNVWGDDLEKQILDLNVTFSRDMVKMVLDNLSTEPTKALIFFRWVDESGLFKHDRHTYNAMARVLGREDCIDRFWKLLDELRSKGYEMEMETYAKVLGRFSKRKMMKEAVNLYEFAMTGANKPSLNPCAFLLRKIAVGKEFDVGLFSRAVRISKENGNVLTDSMLDVILKALASVGRLGEVNKVLKVMVESGFVVGDKLQSKIAFQLNSSGKKEEADEFVDIMESSGSNPDHKTWASIIEGQCISGDLNKASDSFYKMIEKQGVDSSGHALELIVKSYCLKNRPIEASNLLSNLVNKKGVNPRHTTYKMLINKLLVQKGFTEALELMGMMKRHEYPFPPYTGPFIEYFSKSGTADEAIAFLKGMTLKKFPSTSVFLCVFEAFLKSGRVSEAQDFLSQCPGYIRNHADVLNLFSSSKSEKVSCSM